ncbi:MAG TPA: hypothetical protein VMW36_06925, partial [Patescibacteria group bacterium]|nr:hypothetical protein [Patescibacteria group bacterium]
MAKIEDLMKIEHSERAKRLAEEIEQQKKEAVDSLTKLEGLSKSIRDISSVVKKENQEIFSKPLEGKPLFDESIPGVCLLTNHAKMVWQLNKDLIILTKDHSNLLGKPVYVLEGNKCFGV